MKNAKKDIIQKMVQQEVAFAASNLNNWILVSKLSRKAVVAHELGRQVYDIALSALNVCVRSN